MATKKKFNWNRRYITKYYFFKRDKKVMSQGYAATENGSKKGSAKAIILGYCGKVTCYDRVKGRVIWEMRDNEHGGITVWEWVEV